MITAAIVLSVIAVALGSYLVVDMLRGKKKAAALDTESATDDRQADKR